MAVAAYQPSDERPVPLTADRPVAVAVEGVSKSYSGWRWSGRGRKASKDALRDISFEIHEGEMVGLLGPNGAGKTSLLKSIATLLRVSTGCIRVHGHDVEREPVVARRLTGLVTCDERSFYWRLSGRQNLAFFAALYGVPKGVAEARIDGLLTRLGLAPAADRPYHSYSTGMRQKLAIGRGLLAEPKLVLYDEPTRSLDPISARHIREWIVESRELAPSTTHLIATNQLTEAEQLCDRVLILNGGQVIADGSIDRIRQMVHRRGRVVHRLVCAGLPPGFRMGAIPDAEPCECVCEPDGDAGGTTTLRLTTTEESDALSAALRSVLRAGGRVLRCESSRMTFDEVFCSLVLADGQAGRGEDR